MSYLHEYNCNMWPISQWVLVLLFAFLYLLPVNLYILSIECCIQAKQQTCKEELFHSKGNMIIKSQHKR